MNKKMNKLMKSIANVAKNVAVKSSGEVSVSDFYQPTEPKSLKNFKESK